jgi:hypothetical protein
MGDDGALVPILFAMVVDEDLEVGVKTPLKKESSCPTRGCGCITRSPTATCRWCSQQLLLSFRLLALPSHGRGC